MDFSRFGFGLKLGSVACAALFLTGCYKIEIKETLNLDGTADMSIKMDVSQMMAMASGIADSFGYESCEDPKLLAEYEVDTLATPQTTTKVWTETTTLTCELTDEPGRIKVSRKTTFSGNSASTSSSTTRDADSCEDAAILAFYQAPSFPHSTVEESTKTQVITCSETDEKVTITTDNLDENGESQGGGSVSLNKTSKEAMPEQSFCNETDQNPEEMPFFFKGCEDIAPGVGAFNFTKFDTTGLTINNNGTVTYNLEGSTSALQNEMDSGLSENGADSDNDMMAGMNPADMGLVMEYVLVSPWPILEHSAGVKEDENTLRIDLLANEGLDKLEVVLDTDGATIKTLEPSIKTQIDSLVERLAEKLEVSEAPTDRKQEYLAHLIVKIQKLAEMRPNQQVPLGYLQTQLSNLSNALANPEPLDEDLLSELEALEQGVWDEVVEPDEVTGEPEPFNQEVDPAEEEIIEPDAEIETLPVDPIEENPANAEPSLELEAEAEAEAELEVESTEPAPADLDEEENLTGPGA